MPSYENLRELYDQAIAAFEESKKPTVTTIKIQGPTGTQKQIRRERNNHGDARFLHIAARLIEPLEEAAPGADKMSIEQRHAELRTLLGTVKKRKNEEHRGETNDQHQQE